MNLLTKIFVFTEVHAVKRNRWVKQLIDDHDDRSIIDLSCQNLVDPDMLVIVKYAVLEKQCKGLNLWRNQFKFGSLSVLCHFLNDNRTLRELDLSYNQLKDEGVRMLSEVLALNTCVIRDLDLSSNQITDKGAKCLAKMLTTNKRLKILALNYNDITNDGLISLAHALDDHKNNQLKQLRLEANPFITRTGVEYTLNLLKKQQRFQKLYVKDCTFSDDDYEDLEDMAFQTGFDVIARNKISGTVSS